MTPQAAKAVLRNQIRELLQSIASHALGAKRMSVTSDNLCDRLDDIDNELQEVIRLVNSVRLHGEVNS